MKQAQATYSMCIYAINIARIRQNSRKVSVPPTVHVLQIGLAESSSCERIACKWFCVSKFIYIWYFMLLSLCHRVGLLFYPQFLQNWMGGTVAWRGLRRKKVCDTPKVIKKAPGSPEEDALSSPLLYPEWFLILRTLFQIASFSKKKWHKYAIFFLKHTMKTI